MAEKQAIAETMTAVETNYVIERAKGFWAKFSKPIIYIGGAIIVLASAWLIYKNYIVAPKEAKANDVIFQPEHIFDKMVQNGFNKDSINMVLNGGNGITGIVKIATTYDGTAAGNRAHYIAGACYLHNKDFKNAIKHLKDFSTSATQVQSAAYSMLGDAYAELKNTEDAYSYYKKAVSVNDKDEYMTSEALYKAGLYAETLGKTDDAIGFYQKIKDDYPKSAHAADMDKYLARVGVLK